MNNILCSPPIEHLTAEAVTSVKQDLPLTDAAWLLPTTGLASAALERVSRGGCSATCAGLTVRPTSPQLPPRSALLCWKTGVPFAFSSRQEPLPSAVTSLRGWRVAWQSHPPAPSAPTGASPHALGLTPAHSVRTLST